MSAADRIRRTRLVRAVERNGNPTARAILLRLRGSLHWLRRGHLFRRRTVRRYLATSQTRGLQIGAGPHSIEGWLNTDLIAGDIYLDLSRELPIPEASLDFVFGEHVIEHLSERAGLALMREVRRILRPGGVIRLTTPDLQKLIAIYEDRNPVISREDYARHLDTATLSRHERACQVLNSALREWGHRYVYDEEDLTAKLVAVGFTDVHRNESGESRHPPLRDLERHGPGWANAAEAVCLEATVPAAQR